MKKYINVITINVVLILFLSSVNSNNSQTIKNNSNITKNRNYKIRKISKDDTKNFMPLKIYLDLFNFNYTYPNETLLQFKEYFYEAMVSSKNILEKFINISTDTNTDAYYETQHRDEWGLEYWNNSIFEELLDLNVYNYFILFRFDTSINTVASSDIWDEYDAPTIGVITINQEKILKKPTPQKYIKYLMLQQFIHLLGFQIDTDEFTNDLIKEENKKYYISEDDASILFAYAKTYFNCDKIEKIYFELDEDNNIKWPSRLFLGEIMTNLDYPEEKVLSYFTLAYLEDLGYFKIDKKYIGGLFKFGKNKGCKFIFGDCGRNLDNDLDNEDKSVNNNIVFANEFYLPIEYSSNPEPSCTSGRLSKTIYHLHEINEEDEGNNYEYNLINTNYIGVKEVNYCPIAEFNNDINLYTGSCFDDNTQIDNSYYEELGANSFCILSSIINENNYKAVCHKMICSLQSLTIKINNYYIVCPRSGGKIKPDNFNGYILCPDYNLICTGTKLCNNIFDCIKNESEEKENAFNYSDYEIKTTQNSSLYKDDPIIIDNPGELEHNGTCPYLCIQCDLNYKCIKCAPHYKIYNEEENECHEIVPNCAEYTDDNICSNCKSEYSLVKEYNNTLICISNIIINENYYYKPEGNNYYLRCNNTMKYCEKCSEEKICIQCKNNYELIDDSERCDDINLNIYYKDNTDDKYKSCSKYNLMPNCYECEYNGIDEFTCLKCINEYVLLHEAGNVISCKAESTLIGDTKYFKKDENNYYQCDIYNKVENCDTCNSGNECLSCKDGYDIVNENKLCLSSSDIQSKKYYLDNDNNYYYLCSYSLAHCSTCDNKIKCLTCINNDYVIEINDKCIDKDLVTQNYYYLNEENNKYVSCSEIVGCEKCISATECISCQKGFNFNSDNLCKKESSDSKITSAQICGIVIGCVGLGLIFAVIVLLISKKKRNNTKKLDIISTKYEENKNVDNPNILMELINLVKI